MRGLVGLGTGFATVLAVSGPAWAQAPGQALESVDESLEADAQGSSDHLEAETYARAYGLSVEEARQRLEIEADLLARLRRLDTSELPGYAGHWIDHNARGVTAVVATTNRSDEPTIREMVGGAPGIEIQAGARHTYFELHEALGLVSSALRAEAPRLDGNSPSSSIDIRTGEVVLEVSSIGEARARVEQYLPELRTLTTVPISIRDRRGEVEGASANGGGEMWRINADGSLNGTAPSCTAGFSVEYNGPNSGARTGMLTAGHCTISLLQPRTAYKHTTDGTTHLLTHRSATPSYQWDFRWAEVAGVPNPAGRFHVSPTATRPVQSFTAWHDQSVGEYVCHYGSATGYSCGVIDTKTWAPNGSQSPCGTSCENNWVRLVQLPGAPYPTLECALGDSGGPVFVDNTAYGIASVCVFQGGIFMNQFGYSPIDKKGMDLALIFS